MAEPTFAMRALRKFLHRAQVTLPGQTVHVNASNAVDLLSAQKAVLLDDGDLARIVSARREAEIRMATHERVRGAFVK